MIRNVADLLQALMRQESEMLSRQQITHPGVIGEMYEGLTKSLLEIATPGDHDLNVVSGFIVNEHGERSRQIDCMVVEGQGTPVPYTSHQECLDRTVVAVIEVKKRLYSSDVEAAYLNLSSVFKICEPYESEGAFYLLADAYREITRRIIPSPEEVKELPLYLQMIYHSLVVESYKPLRIVLGYDGFVSEFALREAYVQFIEKNVLHAGYSPARFPSLIICGPYSLLKCNGMPYGAPLRGDMWDFYASTSTNPLLLLLELVFTRLTYTGRLSQHVFGEDLIMETFRPLLQGICVSLRDGDMGWVVRSIDLTEKEIGLDAPAVPWEPALLNQVQVVVIGWLCRSERISLDDEDLHKYLLAEGYSIEVLVKELHDFGLVTVDRGELTLLTEKCNVVVTPDGDFYVAEDKSGRLTRWVMRRIKERDEEKP